MSFIPSAPARCQVDLTVHLCKDTANLDVEGQVMKSLFFSGMLVLSMGILAPIATAATFEISSGIVDEINVTSDSSPGWTPTADQRQRAIKAVQVFLDAVEGGRYAEAYQLQAELQKRQVTLEQFIQNAQKFQAQAGPLKFWRVLKVTWTKDSARAPSAGIYVAMDLAAQFANVDRDCGYLVLFQPRSSGDFGVMRWENNFIDNVTAHNIEEK
jgi:Protein of unknown function (DUF4019)